MGNKRRSKVDKTEGLDVIRVSQEDVGWFQVAVGNVVSVQIGQGGEDDGGYLLARGFGEVVGALALDVGEEVAALAYGRDDVP